MTSPSSKPRKPTVIQTPLPPITPLEVACILIEREQKAIAITLEALAHSIEHMRARAAGLYESDVGDLERAAASLRYSVTRMAALREIQP